MALNLPNRYPGRFNPPSASYPQGSFKNRTAPGALDGSYLEQDWANDKEGFFQSLIDAAGLTPNDLPDEVGASQYFDAINSIFGGQGSLGNSGWKPLGGGLILQWGNNNVAGSATTNFSLPVSFANNFFCITGSFSIPAQGTINLGSVSNSQFAAQNTYTGAQDFGWIAIGN